ncbi:MAG: asparagine synthase (glutamine-hydrolyzing) [Acidimicrobiales bacterium]
MCGIAGLFDPSRTRPAEALLAQAVAMGATIRHRGPDADGTWSDPDAGIALAHRRLAVVGLGPEGAQPMASASGRWVITYNGEIYNAPKLAKQLEATGVRLRGTSDTEVLVEALDAWGVARTLELLNGMFAFAAWDREERTLVLARDRLGEKPLLYGQVGGAFAFAPELQAIRSLPGAPTELDPDAVALLLRFKCIPAPWTIHRGIRKLPPGTWLRVGPGPGEVGEPVPYWSMAEVAEAGSRSRLTDEREALDELDRLLGDAVESRLRADVPFGAFLSGGIDSSTVSTLAAERLSEPLRTFTIASDDPDHDESGAAREVADRIGADHTEFLVTGAEALAEVPLMPGRYDEPFADSSQLPTYLVSRLARQEVTVVLSGDGGDEVFGGYNRHVWLPKVWSRIGRIPHPVRRALAAGLAAPSPATWDRIARLVPEARRPPLVGLKVEKLASIVGQPTAAAAYGRLVSHWDDPEAVVPGAHEPTSITHDASAWPHLPTLAEQMMAVDAVSYLPDDVLAKVDRATMAVSLESRVPLLDPDVIAFACRLPLDMRIRDGQGKWALRQLLLRRHPPSLVDRPKSGFGVPIDDWLRGPLRPWAEELLAPARLAEGGLLDPVPVRRAWDDLLSGRRDSSYEVWDVLMLQGWREVNR